MDIFGSFLVILLIFIHVERVASESNSGGFGVFRLDFDECNSLNIDVFSNKSIVELSI